MFFAICIILSCFNVQAIAADVPTEAETGMQYPENFIPISREEYIRTKSEKEGITYAEAEAIVDENIAKAKASLPAPISWENDTIVTNPNGTFTLYGRVFAIYRHESSLMAKYEVQAVMVASHYGRSWAECSSTGRASPYGNGYFDFEGDCSAWMISTTDIRMTLSGSFDIEESYANDLNIDLKLFGYGYTLGNTYHYRTDIYSTHIETIVN